MSAVFEESMGQKPFSIPFWQFLQIMPIFFEQSVFL